MSTGTAGASRSLTARLVIGVALPMAAVALALGVGGTLMIGSTVAAVNDRILDAAARGIADSLTVENGEVALDLPPTVFGMLENTARDNVYYSIAEGGRVLSGYSDLPSTATAASEADVTFADGRYLGRPVRIVARKRRLPGIAEPLEVRVAETLDARAADTRSLLVALVGLEVGLIALAIVLLPLSVRWGLRPVARVREELDRRAASDLTPVPLVAVPTELGDLVTAFNAMLARLAGVLAATRRFTGDASHQLRTPLSILRTHVAVLRAAPPGSAEARQSMADIDGGSRRMAHLIAQLLSLARADNAASAAPEIATVELADLISTVVDEHGDAIAITGSALVVSGQTAAVRTTPALAVELLANLVDNAARHGGPGELRVTMTDGPSVQIEDDGPGIPADHRDRMFDRFTRLSPDGARGGSGLGLSIAQSLAQALGATLTLDAGTGGRGLRATVRFPPA